MGRVKGIDQVSEHSAFKRPKKTMEYVFFRLMDILSLFVYLDSFTVFVHIPCFYTHTLFSRKNPHGVSSDWVSSDGVRSDGQIRGLISFSYLTSTDHHSERFKQTCVTQKLPHFETLVSQPPTKQIFINDNKNRNR